MLFVNLLFGIKESWYK